MPTTLLLIPRELRDEIYTYLALSSSFAFLLTCRQVNEEGTPLLYKHGVYRLRALAFRGEHLPRWPEPPPIAKTRNILVSMPPARFKTGRGGHWDMTNRSAQRLNRFAGTEMERGVCHVDLQEWDVNDGLATVLRGFGGFEVVRVEWPA